VALESASSDPGGGRLLLGGVVVVAVVPACACCGVAAFAFRASSRSSRSCCSATNWLCCAARSPVRGWMSVTASSLLRPASYWAERAGRSSSVRTRCWVGVASLCGSDGRMRDAWGAQTRSRGAALSGPAVRGRVSVGDPVLGDRWCLSVSSTSSSADCSRSCCWSRAATARRSSRSSCCATSCRFCGGRRVGRRSRRVTGWCWRRSAAF
jgi:hypothetical protein